MAHDERDLLDLLTFELKFLEDGGYGRSPRTPWLRQRAFEDSITCPNFGDPSRPHPCSDCLLMRFVPNELKDQDSTAMARNWNWKRLSLVGCAGKSNRSKNRVRRLQGMKVPELGLIVCAANSGWRWWEIYTFLLIGIARTTTMSWRMLCTAGLWRWQRRSRRSTTRSVL
jgi:hypothetical protein